MDLIMMGWTHLLFLVQRSQKMGVEQHDNGTDP